MFDFHRGPSPRPSLEANNNLEFFLFSDSTKPKNIYCSFSYLIRQVGIPTPEKAGNSENCTSGLLNKSSSTEQPAELSSSTTPLPPVHFLHLYPRLQLQRRKAANLQRSKAGAGLLGWGSLVSDVSVGLFSQVLVSVRQIVLRMTPQK